MLAPEGVNGLLHALKRCVQQRNLNASCGVLRRIVSEVPSPDPHDDGNNGSVHYVTNSSPNGSRESHHDILRHQSVTDAIHMAHQITSSSSSPIDATRAPSLNILAHVSQRRGDWKRALQFVSLSPSPPSPSFLSTLVVGEQNWRVIDSWRRHKDWHWNVPMVIDRLGSLGAWHAALQVALDAERASPHSDVYSLGVLVPLLARRSADWSKALRLFQEGFTVGSLLDDDLVATILRGCAASGRWQVAMSISSSLAQTHQLSAKIMSTSVVREIAQLCPQWNLSLALCAKAMDLGATLDARTVESILAKCDRQGAWEEATALFEWATSSKLLEGRLFEGMDSYKAVVRSFHHTAQWERAMEAISWMGHCSDAAATTGLLELVELSEKAGHWDVALQAGAQLLEGNTAEDDDTIGVSIQAPTRGLIPPTTYLSLHYACAAGRQWAASLSLYDRQLTDHRISPHPLAACSVLQACYNAKAWSQGLGLYAILQASKPRVIVPPLAHALTMKLCVEQNRWMDALQLLRWMQADGLPLDNHGQRLGMWASALCGSWLQSLRHYHAIPKSGRTSLDSLVLRKSTEHSGPLAKALVMRQLNS